ncbi:disintegrin and metalloproteinase domain-containing protein 9 [Engraulis encrasicolus]|uniref:disintegrin and metalloproteinase domain-containing protein 9 n=1 Tax=Engraulis encrasicolus TaxID=184585 RepID=UPI002FD4116C
MAGYMILHLLVFIQICIRGASGVNGRIDAQASLSRAHTIVVPKLLHARSKRHETSGDRLAEERHPERVAYSLSIGGKERTLHLEKNRDFLSADFEHYSHNALGQLDKKHQVNHVACHYHGYVACHYHGYVEGDEDSLAAISTCSGLRGVVYVDDVGYGLEPVMSGSRPDAHLVWKLEGFGAQGSCGTHTHHANDTHHQPPLSSLLRRKRNLPQTRYVELVLVVDKQRFDFQKQNMTAVREEAVQLANLLDGYYKRMNVRIVLVFLSVFEEVNPFSVDEGSAGDVLGRFVTWRRTQLLPQRRHDVAQLIVGRSEVYPGGVLGMAFVGTVCSVHNAGGINVFSGTNLAGFSTVLAHELGHVMGMGHDSEGCSCDGNNNCIMSPAAGGATMFSDCSGDYFERLVLGGGGMCLMNQPPPSDVVTVAECGNGVLERGEECDCGTPEECESRCCDAATCLLVSGAVCAQGECCQNCQFKVAGTQCRGVADECDLPEFCNGSFAFCPGDFYRMDGLACANANAFCYEGRCQTYDSQCRRLFGTDAVKANELCFSTVNSRGNQFGNCGHTGAKAIPCALENVMCGKIQCTGFDSNDPPRGVTISIEKLQDDVICKNADYNLGTDVLDPAYVNQGSVCASGKACLDFKCVNDSALLQDSSCTATETCHGNGVCNNEANCHCNDGWAPPSCDRGGRGGSLDSGPAQIDHSLRNGLLIFFLLVLPLLVVLVMFILYRYKPHTLQPLLNRITPPKQRSGTGAPSQANGHQPERAASPPAPKQLAPTNPQPFSPYLTESSASYDPWQTPDVYPEAPAAAAAARQGPGVPRPIPPKHTHTP